VVLWDTCNQSFYRPAHLIDWHTIKQISAASLGARDSNPNKNDAETMNEEIEKLIDQHGVYLVLQSISEIAARRSQNPSAKQIIALWGASAISRRWDL
jgi:hypothetical protein